MRFLVTGAAGFIGFHVCKKLCHAGFEVIGLDNLNNYYDILLKKARLEQLKLNTNFKFIKLNLTDKKNIDHLFCKEKFNRVIHLAAQAGVRYSLENPMAYADSNLTGHLTILESCRQYGTEHLVYASSSSVYGSNTRIPFSVTDNTDHAISLYAATKKANEVMSHAYAHLYNFPATGLRFFTVYGPWGRPDMALFKFTTAMCQGKEIDIYNHGRLSRDFTYIDDIVEGIMRIQSIIPGNTTIS
ncbi:MAG: SDR family NAD(P)-dependent oxidoreductase, partial [Endozoicomonadaceae bacterium]|nr:SDR family NAD(P)-dependent oxidoreductase [Endozoicomonadaceae bacterium]